MIINENPLLRELGRTWGEAANLPPSETPAGKAMTAHKGCLVAFQEFNASMVLVNANSTRQGADWSPRARGALETLERKLDNGLQFLAAECGSVLERMRAELAVVKVPEGKDNPAVAVRESAFLDWLERTEPDYGKRQSLLLEAVGVLGDALAYGACMNAGALRLKALLGDTDYNGVHIVAKLQQLWSDRTNPKMRQAFNDLSRNIDVVTGAIAGLRQEARKIAGPPSSERQSGF